MNAAFLPLLGFLSSNPMLAAAVTILFWVCNNYRSILDNLPPMQSLFSHKHKTIKLTGRIVNCNSWIYCLMSDHMKGVLFFMQNNMDTFGKYAKKIEEIDIESCTDNSRDNNKVHVCIQSSSIHLGNQINMLVKKSQSDKSDSDSNETTIIEVEISSFDLKYSEMQVFLHKCKKEYKNYRNKKLKVQTIFVLSSTDDSKHSIIYEQRPFSTFKRFDNLFFSGKDDLLKRINDFQNNRAEYERIGLPYKLIMLFHGLPGGGKSSCIAAIAQYTKRHIILIRMDKVPDIDTFRAIIMAQTINGIDVPYEDKLFVIEEIDCWLDSLKDRTSTKSSCSSKPIDKNNNNENALIKALIEQNDLNNQQKPSNVNLGGLLELLDGLVELTGCMLIATTNHVDKLDQALIRPGRIDINHCFTRMHKNDVKKAYEFWYQEEMVPHIYDKLEDYMYSQAELAQSFMKSSFK